MCVYQNNVPDTLLSLLSSIRFINLWVILMIGVDTAMLSINSDIEVNTEKILDEFIQKSGKFEFSL